jgi:cytoskeletal protein CcmA (bactofilin family)
MLRMGRGAKPEHAEPHANAAHERATTHQHVPPPTYQPTTPPPPQQPSAQTPRPAAAPQTTKAVTEAESLAREIKDGTMSGFVGGGTALTGEVVFKGMLRVDGHLSGNVRSEKGTLIVSSGGLLDAGVEVAVARVNGTVNGDIVATERIELGRTARVTGNIQTPALSIEQGAIFEGVCRMPRPQPALTARSQAATTTTAAAEAQAREVASRADEAEPDAESIEADERELSAARVG